MQKHTSWNCSSNKKSTEITHKFDILLNEDQTNGNSNNFAYILNVKNLSEMRFL